MFDSPAMAGSLADWFDEEIDDAAYELALEPRSCARRRLVWRDGDSDVLVTEPETTFWQRLQVRIMSWLPGERQL